MQELTSGRTAQKERTRAALLQSARELMASGHRPSVDEVAEAANISKRTAYRYFASQDHMLADAALEALRPEFARLADESRKYDDAADRLAALVQALNRLIPEHEEALKEMVRAALDSSPAEGAPMRGQRRTDWVVEALAPARAGLPDDLYRRLEASLIALVGFDVYLPLRDIVRLPPEKIDETMQWMCQALLEKTLDEARRRSSGAGDLQHR